MKANATILATFVPLAGSKAFAGSFNIALATQEVDSAAISASYRYFDAELVLGYQGSQVFSNNASVAALRGATTIKAGTTLTGPAYVYGTQGKLINKGHLNSSAEVSAALVAQLDFSASQGNTGPVAALWADCGASMGTVTPGNIDAVVVYNTTGAKINAAFRVDTNSAYLMDLTDEGGGHGAGNWIIGTCATSGWDKCLKIKLNGDDYYIPVKNSAT